MDPNTFIISVFCLIGDRLKGCYRSYPQRGPAPKLSDSEVITIEIVGEFLAIDTDKVIFEFFSRHYAERFPTLLEVHRTTFTRQGANLFWKVKEHLWQEFLALAPHDSAFALVDSMPLPACLFASTTAAASEAKRRSARTPPPQADLLRLSGACVRVSWPGLISRLSVAPANVHELSVLPKLLEDTRGLAIGDRNYHSPQTREEVARSMGVALLAPHRSKKRDPNPHRSAYLSRLRYRIETVFSQLTERYSVKRVRAKDLWHLFGRLLRKVGRS